MRVVIAALLAVLWASSGVARSEQFIFHLGCTFPSCFPDATNTGVPAGTSLTTYTGGCTITTANTVIDSKTINCDLSIRANNVTIKNSLINGAIDAGSGGAGEQTGLIIKDSEINCGCPSVGASDTPTAIMEANFTLLRVNLHNSGHGAAVKSNVTIQDSYIHGLGGDTDAHKDGIFSGDGTNVTIQHNQIECNDGPVHKGCTSAIGLLTDFGQITFYTITQNLLNTNGSYCFYGSGGPAKDFASDHITFTNNHFGSAINTNCGELGYVTYFDVNAGGMVWSGNVRHDNGTTVPPVY